MANSSTTIEPSPDRSDCRSAGLVTFVLLFAGYDLMLLALGCELVTVKGSYVGVLVAAITFAVLANICFVTAYRRGGTGARIASVLGFLPTLFVIVEAPYRLFHSLTP